MTHEYLHVYVPLVYHGLPRDNAPFNIQIQSCCNKHFALFTNGQDVLKSIDRCIMFPLWKYTTTAATIVNNGEI